MTKTADVLPVDSCPAPKMAEWTQADKEALAAEISIGEPVSDWEKVKLRGKLNQVLTADKPSLWEEFPYTYEAIADYFIVRAQIDSC